jgi:outer membrane protein TolC
LFTYQAFNGSVGPSFQWNILNYGVLANNVRLQDAKFQQTLLDYRTAVLTANQEVENGLVSFLKSQEQTRMLTEAVIAADKAFQIVLSQYRVGTVDFNRLATIETNLVTAQVSEAQARASIALGLITVYRQLGGGWEIRLGPDAASRLPQPMPAPAGDENAPLPVPSVDPAVRPANPAPQAPLPPPPPKQS